MNIPAVLDMDHRRCIVGKEPMIFHCHHYNTFLQRSIKDTKDYLDSSPFLIGAAEEVAYSQLTQIFSEQGLKDTQQRKNLASELFKWAGFGLVDLNVLGEQGGTTSTVHEHYSMGWKVKWGKTDESVSYFASGWIAGALAAVYGKAQGSYSVIQTACTAKGDATNTFVLKLEKANYTLFKNAGVGTLSKHEIAPVVANNVDYDGILAAVGTLPLIGNDEGTIPAFGVYLTRHYVNYYNRVSFELLHRMSEKFGAMGVEIAEPLLIEAGHVCAFNTFGGIMTSTEWDALIKPNLKNKEDWVHGIVAVVNALGWGRWQVTKVSPKEAEFVIHDDYESVGYKAMYGTSKNHISFLAQGGVTGIMNLVYVGDIASKPGLTEEFYRSKFTQEGNFKCEVLSSLAKGDKNTKFRVYRD